MIAPVYQAWADAIDAYHNKTTKEVNVKHIEEIRNIVYNTLGYSEGSDEKLRALETAFACEDGQPSELEMHRADYRAIKEAGWECPGELLAAHKVLERKYAELTATPTPFNQVTSIELLRVANEAFSQVVDHDFAGNPITEYGVLLWGAYGPAVLRLINLALVKFSPAEKVTEAATQNMETILAQMNEQQFYEELKHLTNSIHFKKLQEKYEKAD